MTGFAVRRLTRALWQFLVAAALFAGAIEFAMHCAGRQGGEESRHVFGVAIEWFTTDAPVALGLLPDAGPEPVSWWLTTWRSLLESLKALGLAVLLVLGLGPPLGILAARFRKWPLLELLVSPLFVAAFWPGFWVACLAIWWQVEQRGLPGFADSATGFSLWWNAFLVAVILAPPAIAWQIRSIAWAIREAAKAGHVRAALSRGQSGSRLFYRHVFSSALDPVTRCLDRVLPVLLGGQLVVEWVLRYPGLGTLIVESARNAHYAGVLAGGLALSLLIVSVRFGGEIVYGMADRRGRESMAEANT